MAISSQNALKHGLTSATVLLPNEDAGQYERLLDSYLATYKRNGDEELRLVQSIVDATWRITRAQFLQAGIMCKGDLEFSKLFQDEPQPRQRTLIEVETYLKYEKSLRNLQMHEARLLRQREKDKAELKRLQQNRKQEQARLLSTNGFEFSSTKTRAASSATNAPQSPVSRQTARSAASNLGVPLSSWGSSTQK